MFNIGFTELCVILLVALLVLGPEKIPEVSRSLARFVYFLRRTLDEVKQDITGPGFLNSTDFFKSPDLIESESPVKDIDKASAPEKNLLNLEFTEQHSDRKSAPVSSDKTQSEPDYQI